MNLRKYILVVALSALVSGTCAAQSLSAAGALIRGKKMLDFYKAAISNPEQILLLSAQIRSLFASSPTRYKGLSNKLGEQVGWFMHGPLALDHIVLSSRRSPSYEFGYFAITLKQVKEKPCKVLANYVTLNANFVTVQVNGMPVFSNGHEHSSQAPCKSQWFFQNGKNTVEYIGY